jgi:protein SCO1/2
MVMMRESDTRASPGDGRPRHTKHLAAVLCLGLLAGCHSGGHWHSTDVTGTLPSLQFTLSRTPDGKQVTAADFRGKAVMLYFGFTHCTTVCPVTMANVARVFRDLGPAASKVRMLFVTVDTKRDTPSDLALYVKNFGPG